MRQALNPTLNIRRARTRDGFTTYDQRTIDATGAFLIGELERLDPTLHDPLVSVTWGRDIDLREDVTIADEVSSFTNSTFAAAGGVSGPNSNTAYGNYGGKAWVGKDTNAIAGVALDIGKTSNPLYLWAMELSYTIPELESAQRVGRPVDAQKFNAIKLKHQMDIDEQVYIGDANLGVPGLINSSAVYQTNVVADANSHTTWAQKISDDTTGNVGANEILADVNGLINAVWANSGWALCPTELRLPPTQFSLLVSTKVSSAGNISILQFLKDNSLSNAINGRPLNIQPLKWLKGAGASNTDRMIAYTKDRERVRFPLVPLQRTPLEYRSLFQLTTYFGRLGVVEFVYPETLGYADAI
jgi:hypothetical protein